MSGGSVEVRLPSLGAVAASLADPLQVIAASGAAQAINVGTYSVIDLTLTANCTLTMSGSSAGSAFSVTIIIRQDGTGGRLVTWPAGKKWAGGAAPTLSTAAGAVDVVTLCTVDNGTTWLGFVGGKAFA